MCSTRVASLTVFLISLAAGSVRAQAPRWVVTNRWQGSGSQQTEMFWVNGQSWRVRYRPKGKSLFQIAVYDAEGKLVDMASNQNRGEPVGGVTTLTGRGQRYFGITGMDTTWELAVEQHVTTIEEWHLRQLLQQPLPQMVKLGIWTGGDGQSEYTFTVPSRSWQVRHSHSGDGLLQIVVEDAAGFVALGANEVRSAEGLSWVHKAGTFTMRINADAVNWKVEVLCEDTAGAGE
jgi:hypothetical protein